MRKKKYKNSLKEDTSEFKEPTKKVLNSEIGNLQSDPDFVVYNNIFPNPDKLISRDASGIKLYDKILDDCHSRSVLETRWQSVVCKDWQVQPPVDPSKTEVGIAEFVTATLTNTNFDECRFHLLRSILYGYSSLEIIYKLNNKKQVIVDKFIDKHPRRISFDAKRRPRLLTINNLVEGELIPDKKFLVMSYGSQDNPYGSGLGIPLYWMVWMKHNALKFWNLFLEKYASPTLWGKYPTGTTGNDRDTFKEVLESVQKDSCVVLPEAYAVEMLEATRSSSNTYDDVCNFFNREISKVVLGQVLTTENSATGSYSLGKVQENVRKDIIAADADLLDSFLNRTLVKWIVDFNFEIDPQRYPKLVTITDDPQNLSERIKIDASLAKDIGVRLTPEYVEKTYSVDLEDKDPPVEEEQTEIEQLFRDLDTD